MESITIRNIPITVYMTSDFLDGSDPNKNGLFPKEIISYLTDLVDDHRHENFGGRHVREDTIDYEKNDFHSTSFSIVDNREFPGECVDNVSIEYVDNVSIKGKSIHEATHEYLARKCSLLDCNMNEGIAYARQIKYLRSKGKDNGLLKEIFERDLFKKHYEEKPEKEKDKRASYRRYNAKRMITAFKTYNVAMSKVGDDIALCLARDTMNNFPTKYMGEYAEERFKQNVKDYMKSIKYYFSQSCFK